jgi:hypothetical protein
MVLEITNSERDLMFELIEAAHREMIHEIDHTDAREFKKRLQEKLALLEHVGSKIGGTEPIIRGSNGFGGFKSVKSV